MMKILYWTPFFLPDIGGIETLSAKLLPELRKRDYDIAVLTSHGSYDMADRTEFGGVPVFRFHFREVFGKHDLQELFRLRGQVIKLKQSFKPDLVHIHMSDPSVFFHLSTLSAFPAPAIVTIHQDTKCLGLKGGTDTLLGNTLRMTEWVTAVSRATLSDLLDLEPGIKNRSSVIYNGLNVPDAIPAALPLDPPRILCLGRLIHAKGVDLVIAAFSSVLKRFPRARLTIAGEGPERVHLEKKAAGLGLADSVEFAGRVEPEEVPLVINQAAVVVMPSRVEGFPMRALEAAMMARPVVATPAGGLEEAIIHGQTGLIVEKENDLALAEAIAFLLDHPDVAVRMGQAARSRVLEAFSLDRCVDSYDTLYRRLIRVTPHRSVLMEQ